MSNPLRNLTFEQIDDLMVKSASGFRVLIEENKRLRQALADRDRRDQSEKIASAAVEKGWVSQEEADTYASNLYQNGKDLSPVEELVNHSATGIPLSPGIQKVASDLGGDQELDPLTLCLLENQ